MNMWNMCHCIGIIVFALMSCIHAEPTANKSHSRCIKNCCAPETLKALVKSGASQHDHECLQCLETRMHKSADKVERGLEYESDPCDVEYECEEEETEDQEEEE